MIRSAVKLGVVIALVQVFAGGCALHGGPGVLMDQRCEEGPTPAAYTGGFGLHVFHNASTGIFFGHLTRRVWQAETNDDALRCARAAPLPTSSDCPAYNGGPSAIQEHAIGFGLEADATGVRFMFGSRRGLRFVAPSDANFVVTYDGLDASHAALACISTEKTE